MGIKGKGFFKGEQFSFSLPEGWNLLAMAEPKDVPGLTDVGARVRELLLLKPKLAYQAAREPKVKPLADVLDVAIDQVEGQRERFQRLVELFEAILAYHTKYGGK